MSEYKYDIYLSFTGADRELKNDICQRLHDSGFNDVYDSDAYCKGQFRQDYMEALMSSKVFLMILSDNLRNDPAITSHGTLSEVRKELSLACELEAMNKLNIVILCMSEFFKYQSGFRNVSDTIGWLFYTHTRGFSYVNGAIEEDGLLKDQAYHSIETRARSFIEMRDAGTPIISQAQKLDISKEKIVATELFVGRKREIDTVIEAYREGKQAVVLSGIGGMGKSRLALEIASICSKEFYFNCPQIVQIGEQNSSLGGLYTVANNTSYVAEVYDSLAYLSEHDKYMRKVKALTDLPENVLLVVDNFNGINTQQLNEILGKLKCRILITTRAHFDVNGETTKYLNVDKIDAEDARALFSRLCGFDVDTDSFEQIYNKTNGHTITLCIFAKMVKEHGISIEDLEKKMDDFDKMEEVVDQGGHYDTIFGHLNGLFKVSDFKGLSLDILRSMSILYNGTITVADLVRVLELKNRNEINELVRTGWLEQINGTEPSLYLHPIIASMVQKALKPSEENVPQMIYYIKDLVSEQKENMTYRSLDALCQMLHYAINVLATSSGNLCYTLWEEYVVLNRILGNSPTSQARTAELCQRLENESDINSVTMYSSTIIIEENPTKLELLDDLIDKLEKNANDYKWVLRCLSISFVHVCGIKDFAPKLEKIIIKAFNSAMIAQDNFSITYMLAYLPMLSHGERKKMLKKIEAYIKTVAEENRDGDYYYLKLIHLYFKTFMSKKNCSSDNFMDIVTQNLAKLATNTRVFMIVHPFLVRKMIKITDEFDKLDKSDPVNVMFSILLNMGDAILESVGFDIMELLKCVVMMYERQMEKGVTLISADQMVKNTLRTLGGFTSKAISNGISQLTTEIDLENVTVNGLSRLQVASVVSRMVNDESAITHSENVYLAMSRVRPKGHTDVIQAKRAYAENVLFFAKTAEERRKALDIYMEIYNELCIEYKDSKLLSDIAYDILNFAKCGTLFEDDFALKLLEIVSRSYDETTYVYNDAFFAFFTNTLVLAIRSGKLFEYPKFRWALDTLAKNARAAKNKASNVQSTIMYTISQSLMRVHAKNYPELYDELLAIFKSFTATGKALCASKKALYTRAYYRKEIYFSDSMDYNHECYVKTIDAYVKSKMYSNYASYDYGVMLDNLKSGRFTIRELLSKLLLAKNVEKAACDIEKLLKNSDNEAYESLVNDNEAVLGKIVRDNLEKVFKKVEKTGKDLISSYGYTKIKSGKEYIDKYTLLLISELSKSYIDFAKNSTFSNALAKRLNENSFGNFKPKPVTKITTKKGVGPNDPCPCGSGKKYKRCCGEKSE